MATRAVRKVSSRVTGQVEAHVAQFFTGQPRVLHLMASHGSLRLWSLVSLLFLLGWGNLDCLVVFHMLRSLVEAL